MMPVWLGCVIGNRLEAEHECAELVYRTATDAMIAKHADASAGVFNTLRGVAEDARIDCEAARLMLEKHRRVTRGSN
jgi:hypothetical protein